jgi:hypothetical protein
VNRSLSILHAMAIVCGIVFAATSMINLAVVSGSPQPFAWSHIVVYLMIALTLVSMFGVGARMQVLRGQMAMIDEVPKDDPRRVEFNALHVWSTRLEGTVLLLGLGLLFLTARRLS